MRKRLINIFIVVILAFSISGCAQTAADTPAAEAETVESEHTENMDEEETDIEDADKTVIGEAADEEEDGSKGEVREEVENIEDMPEIEIVNINILEVKIKNEGEYEGFVSRLKEFTHCHSLWMDIEETDTTIYLDEILTYNNFDDVMIKNGGNISVRNMEDFTDSMTAVSLRHVFSIDEGLLSHIISSNLCAQAEIRIVRMSY